jgi:hypothetical protein
MVRRLIDYIISHAMSRSLARSHKQGTGIEDASATLRVDEKKPRPAEPSGASEWTLC